MVFSFWSWWGYVCCGGEENENLFFRKYLYGGDFGIYFKKVILVNGIKEGSYGEIGVYY